MFETMWSLFVIPLLTNENNKTSLGWLGSRNEFRLPNFGELPSEFRFTRPCVLLPSRRPSTIFTSTHKKVTRLKKKDGGSNKETEGSFFLLYAYIGVVVVNNVMHITCSSQKKSVFKIRIREKVWRRGRAREMMEQVWNSWLLGLEAGQEFTYPEGQNQTTKKLYGVKKKKLNKTLWMLVFLLFGNAKKNQNRPGVEHQHQSQS